MRCGGLAAKLPFGSLFNLVKQWLYLLVQPGVYRSCLWRCTAHVEMFTKQRARPSPANAGV